MQPNFAMWPFWREKYMSPVGAMQDYYPEVLAAEPALRLELIRIEAYETLIDKLMAAHEDRQVESDSDAVPLWSAYKDRLGYAEALTRYYGALLQESEPLLVALKNIAEAEAAIDSWMTNKSRERDPADA